MKGGLEDWENERNLFAIIEEGDILRVRPREVETALPSQGKECRSAIGTRNTITMSITTCLNKEMEVIR